MIKYKYRNIAEFILGQIRSGKLAPGVPVPSTREISEEYQVSQLTAIRALSYLAKKGSLVHCKGRNYCVSHKLTMEEESIHFVALLFRYISFHGPEFYGNKIISGISREAAMASVSTYLSAMSQQYYMDADKDPQKILKEALSLPKQNIGFIADFFIPDEIISEIIQVTHLPVVLVGRVSQCPDVSSVVPNAVPAYHTMLHTMERLGYNAFICCEKGEPEREEIRQQSEFFKELAQNKKCVRTLQNFSSKSSAQQIDLLSSAIQELQGHRIAVLASSDVEAREILGYLSDMNIKVPEEIGVVGFYGTRVATDFSPRLSCLAVSPEILGQTAAQLLISKNQRYGIHKIPMEFIFGETI